MPLRVVCSSCGEILYEDLEVRPIDSIVKAYNGHCPKCRKELKLKLDEIRLRKRS